MRLLFHVITPLRKKRFIDIIYYKALILLMPKGGLEPPCPQGTPDFESGASASSTTPACGKY